MSLLTVDMEKCKRDGICNAVCLAEIVEFKDEKAFLTPIEGGDNNKKVPQPELMS